MKTGRVKFFNEAKGFGFIIADDNETEDIFVHVTGLKETVKENDKVSFLIKEGKKGPNAYNVEKVNG